MKKLLFFAAMCIMALSLSAKDYYVDLGLPSGTKWKTTNEEGYYTYYEAMSEFGDNLPTREQFEELLRRCTWIRLEKESKCKVVGPNGKFIFLPVEGIILCNSEEVEFDGWYGYYWSRNGFDTEHAWYLFFYSADDMHMDLSSQCSAQSVRLVRK